MTSCNHLEDLTPDDQNAYGRTLGYQRDPAMAGDLNAVLALAMIRHPNMRLGQMLFNATRGHNLFQILDEDLLVMLRDFAHRE